MGMIERLPITSEAEWLEWRRHATGASEAAALPGINVHEWKTPLELFAEKHGDIAPQADNPAMKRGRKLERVAIDEVRELRPDWQLEVPRAVWLDRHQQLIATPDLLATDPQHGLGTVQIKTAEESVFRRRWITDGELRVPTWVGVQCNVEAAHVGAAWAAVAVLVIGHGLELHMADVPLHAALMQRVRDANAEFWHDVRKHRRPSADYGRDLMVLKALLPKDDGTEIDLTGDNSLPARLAERAEAKAAQLAAEARIKAIDAEILDKLGTATVGILRGGYITAKTINRKAYEVKASSYRQIRIVGEAA